MSKVAVPNLAVPCRMATQTSSTQEFTWSRWQVPCLWVFFCRKVAWAMRRRLGERNTRERGWRLQSVYLPISVATMATAQHGVLCIAKLDGPRSIGLHIDSLQGGRRALQFLWVEKNISAQVLPSAVAQPSFYVVAIQRTGKENRAKSASVNKL